MDPERFGPRSPRARLKAREDAEESTSDRTLLEELGLTEERVRELARAWDRVRTAAIRGAAAGALIKGGLHTLTFAVHLLSRLRGKGRQRLMTLGDVLHDTCLHTCFLAILGSSYTLTDEAIALVFGKESTQRWRALVAGLVAGQALRITGPRQRHYSLATYILLRGLTLLVRTGNKPSAPLALRALLRPTRLAHGDTLLMCLAASQILYSFIMEPASLPPSYVRFINRMGGKEPAVWAAMREHALRNACGQPPGPLASLARSQLAHLNARPGRLRPTPCEFFHPGQSCCGHALSVLPPAYSTALSVYVPFYAVSSVLVHRSALLAKPGELLPKMAVGVLRSSAFLAAYMAAAFAGACAGFNIAGVNTGPVIAASVWVGGLATLIEKKSRRMELAMYCAARALEAFIRCWRTWSSAAGAELRFANRAVPVPHLARAYVPPLAPSPGGLRPPLPPRGLAHAHAHGPAHAHAPGGWLRLDVLLFSLGCGAIMHCYSDACGQHRDVFRSKYLNVLDFVFGNEGVQSGSISHVPTNRELVTTVGRRIRTMSIGVMSHAHSGGAVSGGPSGEYSPLPRSAEASQADGLYAMRGGGAAASGGGGGELSNASSSAAFGHGHHGGQGYSRYLQQQPQGTSPQLGHGAAPPSPYGVAAAMAAAAGAPAAEAAAAAASPLAVALVSPNDSSASLPVSPVHGLTGHGSASAMAGAGGKASDAAREAAARLAAATALAGQQAHQAQQIVGQTVAGASSQGAHPDRASSGRRGSGGSDGSSSGGDGSSSGSGWEDVWAATAGVAPTAGTAAAGAARGDGGGGNAAAAAAGDAAAQALGEIQAAALSAGAPAAAAAGGGSGGGAFGWAVRLVAGALGGSRGGSRAGSSAALAAAEHAAPPSAAESAAESVAAAAAAGDDGNRTGGPAAAPSAARGVGGLRRIATAPQVLLLLSDPASERSGRGRSSYQRLQELSADSDGDADAASSGSPVRAKRLSALPNAASRTPAFRSSAFQRPPQAGGGAWPLAQRRAGGGSIASAMDRLTPDGSASAAAAAAAALPRAGSQPLESLSSSAAGAGAAARAGAHGGLCLAPRGSWSHTSPVPGAAAWPRFSTDAGAVAVEERLAAAAAELGSVAESEAEEELSRSAP